MLININRDNVEIVNEKNINSGAIQYYEVKLNFDESWNGLTKVMKMINVNDGEAQEVAVIDDTKVCIDAEYHGTYDIGFIGYTVEGDKKIYQISTELKPIYVDMGAGEITGSNRVPKLNEWELYIQQIKEMCDGVVIDRIEKTATEDLVDTHTIFYTNGTKYEFTVTNAHTPVKGEDYYTNEEKTEMKNEILSSVNTTLNNNLKEAKDYTDNAIVRDFKDITFNETTMTFVFTRHDNTTFTVDLPIEQTVKNGYYDAETKELVLVLVSGQEIRIPASGLISDYDGVDSATIQCVVSADNKISCNIIAGSITKTLLTAELQEEINGKLNKADITERLFEITYEDGSVDEIRSVIFK